MVFRSLVTQLSKDNEKFVYSCVREGARSREFEEAIEWLVSAGMVLRIYNVSKPEHLLIAHESYCFLKISTILRITKKLSVINKKMNK